ncbi:hypothetical protein QA599_07915 [Haloarculaceae archaeon H-GB1-1]|nr:hypothetical protein [Haloarculaceae archaeon H-GB1-1]
MYDLSTVLDVEELSSVKPGSGILIAGPAMTGKQQLAMDILAEGSREGEGAVIVSTGDSASDILANYRERVPSVDESRVGIVDTRSEGGRSEDYTNSGTFVHHVSSPGDLTGIGIGITKCLESLHNSGADNGRLALVSLSTMLTYTDKKTVFKFCHVLSSRLDAAGYLGLFTIDSGAHDDQTIQVIKQAFDGLIEIRENEGDRQVRVLGLGGQPTDWSDF